MTEVIDKSQLFSKVALVMGQVRTMPKNGENTYDKYSYVTADSAFERLGAAMAAAKLVALPSIIELRTDEVPAASGKMQTRSIIHGQITLADGDTGATWTNDWWGEGIDRGDKSINKAITAMMKYHLLRLFMVGTGEDADSESPEIEHKAPQRTQSQQSSNHTAQHRTAPQRPAQPARINPVPEDVQFMPENEGIPFGHEDNPFNDPTPAPVAVAVAPGNGGVNPKKLNVLNALGSTFYNARKNDEAWDKKREELCRSFGVESSTQLNNAQADTLIAGLEKRIRQVVADLPPGLIHPGELPVIIQECTAYGDKDGVQTLEEAKGVGLAKVLQEVKRRKVAA